MSYRVIKEDDLFLLTDDIGTASSDAQEFAGLFTDDTRFLKHFELSVENLEMILLSSEVSHDFVGTILLTNKEVVENGEVKVWRESIGAERKRFISAGVLYETLTFRNHNTYPVQIELSIRAEADYAHMFTVRGYEDAHRGELLPTLVREDGLTFAYNGLDGHERKTHLTFAPQPSDLTGEGAAQGSVRYRFELEPHGSYQIELAVETEIDGQGKKKIELAAALQQLRDEYKRWNEETTHVETDNAAFNRIFRRSKNDMRALLTDLGEGRFPVAGVPVFAVPFGRDSLIAAWQTAAIQPDIMRGTLKTMASKQGQKSVEWTEEAPGKILHEIRYGELANLGVIPHAPYYGTIDATPLFLVLAAEYYYWTGDEAFIRELLPNIEAALGWIDQYGDRDGDGYVEYYQESSKGCTNQGWKDSGDCMVHRSGRLAEASIALSEVQGYVYDAKMRLAVIFERLGYGEKAAQLLEQARRLKERFAQDFWMEDVQYVALALDKHKAQVGSVSSNPGHCLLSGLLTDEQAEQVANRLLSDDMFSGWGIRTLSAKEKAFNPMSYHNGSVWPHDNSLVVMGLKRYGFHEHADRVIEGLLETAQHFEYDRLPELFCGFEKDLGYPVPYPVACSPQAWAAGTALTFVRVMLGLMPDVPAGFLQIAPSLPNGINRMEVKNLRVGNGSLDLLIQKDEKAQTTFKVLRNSTGLTITVS